MIFRFADYYYYQNQKVDFNSLKDSEILDSFENYLTKEKFTYESDAEKEVEKLLADAKSNKYEKSITESLTKVKDQLEKIGNKEINIYKDEVLRELKGELASRYLGTEGKIEELLASDPQFQTALKVLDNTKLYNKLLNSK